MNFFERRARLKNANALDLTPKRVMGEELGENNLVLILMPRFTNRFVKKYIVPNLKTPYVKIKLDTLGSAAWLAIDGQKKVGAIADELTQKFTTETDIIDRLTKFFSFLYEQRMITFQEILDSKTHRA